MTQPFGLMLLKSAIIQSWILSSFFLSQNCWSTVKKWRGVGCSHGHRSKAGKETSANAHNHKTSISEMWLKYYRPTFALKQHKMKLEDVTHSYWNSVQLTYCFDSIACTEHVSLATIRFVTFTVTCATPGEADDAFSLLLYFFLLPQTRWWVQGCFTAH